MKKLISATLAASLALSLAACGSSASTDSVAASSEAASAESTAASSEAAESTAETSELAGTTLKVAASPTPHAEILNVAKEILAEQGIDLEVVEFSDYVQPNLVTENGEVDANYFQHTPTSTASTRRTVPIWSASARSTMSRLASIRARAMIWQTLRTARPSPCPTTPPTRPALCSCWPPRA